MITNKTVNRGWLMRQVKSGKVEGKVNYHYTDDYAWDAATDFGKTEWMPAVLKEFGTEHKDNCLNLREFDFKCSSGSAYYNEKGELKLYVHSNLSMTLRIV